MSFEGQEYLDIEFGDIVPCDCSEGSYGHINALVVRNCCSRLSFGDSLGHFGGFELGGSGQMISEGGESKVSSVESWRPRLLPVEPGHALCLPDTQ